MMDPIGVRRRIFLNLANALKPSPLCKLFEPGETIPVQHPQETPMAQVEEGRELLRSADQLHSSHLTLIEAHELLTGMENRLLGGAPLVGQADGQTEDSPSGFLPRLEREARRVNQSASALLRRLESLLERLGVDYMEEFDEEVPGPRPGSPEEPGLVDRIRRPR